MTFYRIIFIYFIYADPQSKRSQKPIKQWSSWPPMRLLNLHLRYESFNTGKHSCPEPQVPFQADSSYHRDYKPYEVMQERQKPSAYKPIQRNYDPQAIKSTYETTYKPVPIQIEEPIKASRNYRTNTGKLET